MNINIREINTKNLKVFNVESDAQNKHEIYTAKGKRRL